MKPSSIKFYILFAAACIIGYVLAKIDTSKNWDDTGITVGCILISSFVLGSIMTKFAWLWATIIGGFIFGFNIILNKNFGSAGALVFAFIGAYIGVFFRKYILNTVTK